MFWSTKNSTVYSYPSPNIASPSTVTVTGGGGGGSSGIVAIPASSIVNTATGSTGLSGQYLGTSGWTSVVSSSSNLSQGSITISGNIVLDNDVAIINTKKHKIDIDKVYENLQIINEMFHVIVPDFNKFEKHPTLMDAFVQYDSAKHIEPRYNSEEFKAAYHQFKLLEALLTEEKNDNS
jgi:hypothetical protein